MNNENKNGFAIAEFEGDKIYIMEKLKNKRPSDVWNYLSGMTDGRVQDIVEYMTGTTQRMNSKAVCFGELVDWYYTKTQKNIDNKNN